MNLKSKFFFFLLRGIAAIVCEINGIYLWIYSEAFIFEKINWLADYINAKSELCLKYNDKTTNKVYLPLFE